MSADESEQFVRLLYRYAETELDQWDNWRLDTEVGPVYVSMSMELLPDWSDRAFDPVPEPGTRWQAGRFAQVDRDVPVASRQDVQRVIAQMRADLAGPGRESGRTRRWIASSMRLKRSWTGSPADSPGRGRLKPCSPTGRSLRTSWSPPPDTSKQLPPHQVTPDRCFYVPVKRIDLPASYARRRSITALLANHRPPTGRL